MAAQAGAGDTTGSVKGRLGKWAASNQCVATLELRRRGDV